MKRAIFLAVGLVSAASAFAWSTGWHADRRVPPKPCIYHIQTPAERLAFRDYLQRMNEKAESEGRETVDIDSLIRALDTLNSKVLSELKAQTGCTV